MPDFADAAPAKRFFIEMLTRDIRLEDAILDLIDNAIDSVIRYRGIDLQELVLSLGSNINTSPANHWIRIHTADDCFHISDNCGGIDISDARRYVFRFGSDEKPKDSRLSVYGIGLKRAIFKIGRLIEFESRTAKTGFKVTIDVDKWEKETGLWQFPLEEIPAANTPQEAGTSIKISKIVSSTSQRLQSGSFESRLVDSIGESHALLLNNIVNIEFDENKVVARNIPISHSDDANTSITKEQFEDVDVTIVAGLQKLEGMQWKGNTAGWYIICNGRVVVFADQSQLTGWGTRSLPLFQPKHRGFIGIVLFLSDNPESLPWTTTKRGINAEAPVFQFVRERMVTDARPVLSFLDKRYSSVPVSAENTDSLEVKDNSLANALQPAQLSDLLGDAPRRFSTSKEIAKKPTTVSVQYRTSASNIEQGRRIIGGPTLAAGRVGLHALKYFLDNEAD